MQSLQNSFKLQKHRKTPTQDNVSTNPFKLNEDVYLGYTYITPVSSTVIDTEHFDFPDRIEADLERY
jgi:hypothetical protein